MNKNSKVNEAREKRGKKDKNREGDQIVLTSAHTILVRFIAELNRKRFFLGVSPSELRE